MIAKFSVRKVYTVLVGVALILTLGIVSFTRMTTDLLPNISLPYVIVMTTYTGASPEAVETVVTKPVESSMATVSNIENISSVSGENYSMVILEFAQSTDMDSISLEIREKLDQIKGYWDDSVGNPIIMKLNPDMLPVMVAAIGVEGMDNAQVSELAKNSIIPELESIEGVASASAAGLIEESVNVLIRQDKIDEINEQVQASINGEMADAEQDLADSKKTIAEKQSDLADAENKIADGRQEIDEKKSDLEEGKNELNEKKTEAAAKLAETETKLLTAKADLESAKTSLTTQIETVNAAADGLKKARDGLAQLDAGIALLEENIPALEAGVQGMGMSFNLLAGVVEGLKASGVADPSVADVIGAVNAVPGDVLPEELRVLLINELNKCEDESTPYDAFAPAVQESLGVQLTDLQARLTEASAKLDELKLQRVTVQETVDKLQSGLDSLTMGLGQEAFLAKMQGTLETIKGNIEKVDEGLTELYKGNLEAAVELSNAQSQLNLGELQINTAETQLDASEDQLEAGRDQIKDALDQIKDGEEQLEEARDRAYRNADMSNVLTVDTVKSLLSAQNFSMPGGYVTEDGIEYMVRVGDKAIEIGELREMPLMDMRMDGVDVITLGDVADVFMTDNSDEVYTNVNGSPGILFTVQKQTGYSTGDVSDKLKEKFAGLMAEDDKLTLLTLMDQGIYIDLVMDSIINNVLFGAALAILILILFLKDLRPTLIIACSIPISLVAAVVCMYFSGVTLNIISLSGLALGIGMLVDNSIVVIENIYRLRSEGREIREAAVEGAREVAGAIAASTLTTVCVFAPIVFTEGITRQLFVDMGLTIAYSLLASLLIALTVVPSMASRMLKKAKEHKRDRFFGALIAGYDRLLRLALKGKPLVLLVVVVLLIVSAAASISRGTAFMTDMDSTQLSVSVETEEGTPLAETGEVTDEIVERIRSLSDVRDVGAMTGGSSMSMLTESGQATNRTALYVVLKEDKQYGNEELAAMIYDKTADLEGVNITVDTSSMDMSAMGGSGISIQVRGRDLDTLHSIAGDIAGIVEGVEGTEDIFDGMEEKTGELRVRIDKEKAAAQGLTVAQVFQQIAGRLAQASSATTLETNIKDYDVYVINENDRTLTRDTLKNLEIDITDEDGNKAKIPLADIAFFYDTETSNSIRRADQSRYVEVSAAIADGYNVGLVSNALQKELDQYSLPSGYSLVMQGENETINDAIGQVSLMLILALLFMYLIMVAQFQSLLSPFIIMFTIPLAFTGGFLGLYFSNSEVSVIALIGFVMLSGIIVNNGIVLVDYVNQLRAEGMEKREAVLTAGRTRLRPVLMTALTTILALSTMVFSKDMGAEMAKPMAIVTIGGLTYGTLLTLIVIPCIYDIFMREKKSGKEAVEDGIGGRE